MVRGRVEAIPTRTMRNTEGMVGSSLGPLTMDRPKKPLPCVSR